MFLSVYRGFRGRTYFRIQAIDYLRKRRRTALASTTITRVVRGYLGRCQLKRMKRERRDNWIKTAKNWKETFSKEVGFSLSLCFSLPFFFLSPFSSFFSSLFLSVSSSFPPSSTTFYFIEVNLLINRQMLGSIFQTILARLCGNHRLAGTRRTMACWYLVVEKQSLIQHLPV